MRATLMMVRREVKRSYCSMDGTWLVQGMEANDYNV